MNLQQKSAEIVRNLKDIWRLDHLNPEDLDPVILMMMGACLYESSRIENLLEQNDKYVINKLIDNILPYKYTLPIPANALVTCNISEPDFEITDKVNFRLDSEGESFNFIPLLNTNVFNAKILYSVKGNKLYKHQKDKNEVVISDLRCPTSELQNIWLGLDVAREVKTLKGLSFSINMTDEYLHSARIDYLLNIKRYIGNFRLIYENKELKYDKLINPDTYLPQAQNTELRTLSYFNYFNEIRKEILNKYADKIYYIEDFPNEINRTGLQSPSLELNKTVNEKAKEKLVWVQIKLPQILPPEMLNNCNININCFPVANCRKLSLVLDKFYSVRQFPNQGSEKFLTITDYDVFDEESQRNITNRFKDDYPFILRDFGIKKIDEFEVVNLLNEVFERFKTDYFSLKKITGIDEQAIDKLNDALQVIYSQYTNELRTQSAEFRNKTDSPWAILHYDILRNDTDKSALSRIKVNINYISTNGKIANFIKNSELKCDKSAVQLSRFIIKPAEGKDLPDIKDKEYAIKYSLLTNDSGTEKIVTKEDIKSFCYYLLGDKIKNLNVYNSVCIGEKKGMGILRCINVDINIKQDTGIQSSREQNANFELINLQNFIKEKLEFRSSNILPYNVTVQYA